MSRSNVLVVPYKESWAYVIVPQATHYAVHMVYLPRDAGVQTASLKEARAWCERSNHARRASQRWLKRKARR